MTKSNYYLKRERELRGWSQKKVAESVGATSHTVSRWERGRSFPYPHYREQLCMLFGKNAQELGLVQDENEETARETPSAHLSSSPLSLTPEHIFPVHDPMMPVMASIAIGLIGRTALFTQVKRLLCAGDSEMSVALKGLPGMGKTTLAMALASDSEIQTYFSDGILWAGLGPAPNLLSLLSRWGALLGVSSSQVGQLSSIQSWGIALRKAIGKRRMLLVIDDAWDVQQALALRVGGVGCSYVLTTRFPPLALAFADGFVVDVPELDDESGLAMLAHFAPEVVEQDIEAARTLVRTVGASPLALTLLGKHLGKLSYRGPRRRWLVALNELHSIQHRMQVSMYLPQMDRPPALSTETPLSLQAAIEISDKHLSEQARESLRALSVFLPKPNSFAEEAALAICQVPAEVLGTLTGAGLLEVSGPQRYMLHQTIADYAKAHLTDVLAETRMVNYFVQYIKAHAGNHRVLRLESNNILFAIQRAFELHLSSEGRQGTYALMPFLFQTGLYTIAESLLQNCYDSSLASNDDEDQMLALLDFGRIMQAQGKLTEAKTYLLNGLVLARMRKNHDIQTRLFMCLGAVEGNQGNYSRAQGYFQEGLNLTHEAGLEPMRSRFLMNLGVLAADKGEYGEAEPYFQEGLVLARESGNNERISLVLLNSGWVANELGAFTRAEMWLQEGLLLARQQENYDRIHGFLIILGNCATNKEDYAQAEAYLQESMSIAHTLRNEWHLARSLEAQGDLYLKQHRPKRATAAFSQALELVPPEQRKLRAFIHYGLAQAAAAQDDINQAHKMGKAALEILQTIDHKQSVVVQCWLDTLSSRTDTI